MKNANIVIIDDEEDILEFIKYNLEKERAYVHAFSSGTEGLNFIKNQSEKLDAVISDWTLTDFDGLEICKEMRRNPLLFKIPFIMLTGKQDEIDVVTALEIGADDYLVKPIRMRELISRTKKAIKRNNHVPVKQKMVETAPVFAEIKQEEKKEIPYLHTSENSIDYKDLMIDVEKYRAFLAGKEMNLTLSEFKLLNLLAKKPGKVFTRNQIIEKLNGFDYFVTERSIDVQIVGLRKKLGKFKSYLETVRGVGYRLRD